MLDEPRPTHLFYQTRKRRPLVDRAEGIYIWDVHGRRYVDGSSGAMVVNIGHGNPRVLQAMQRQMQRATFAYRLHFENEAAEEYARELVAAMPAGFERVFFVSGGSEAVESCLKLARQYALAIGQTERYKVIARYPSYHGATFGALAITGSAPFSAPFAPMLKEMPHISAPTCYLDRDPFSLEQRGRRYADLLEQEILRQGPDTVLAFIMEPIGGASTGALVAPDSYYPRIREICDRYGVLLIYDEVMSGAGRTGRFLATEHWPVRPDLIALSKGLASGYCPLGAMVAPPRLVEPVLDAGGFQHGYTYAGNPLACAAGRAVLAEMLEQRLLENTRQVGGFLRQQLELLQGRFPFIGDVRGKGLLLAVELVADRQSMEPLAPALNAHALLVELAYQRGLILYSRRTRGGIAGDHVMICPPMIVTREQVEHIVGLLADSLQALAEQLGLPLG
jgi:adenosylmethionine-8-amino-7-oxononanoate aminotransferase